MPIVHGYSTLAECKKRQNIRGTSQDEVIKTTITATSRLIDDYTRRRFYASTETRVYSATDSRCLLIDDLLTLTTLKTDIDGDQTYETTWATTDYVLGPPNAALNLLPYWQIRTTVLGVNWFPQGIPNGVQVVGSWGYSTTAPVLIAEACIAQVGLFLRTPDVSLHESGAGPTLQQLHGVGLHPFVKRMIDPYTRSAVG